MIIPLNGFAQSESIIVKYKGVDGYWFPEAVGDRILKDLEELNDIRELKFKLELKIDTLEGKVLIQQEGIEKRQAVIDLDNELISKQDSIISGQETDIAYQQEQIDKLEASKKKWYNNKLVLIGIGVVVGSASCFGISMGLKRLAE